MESKNAATQRYKTIASLKSSTRQTRLFNSSTSLRFSQERHFMCRHAKQGGAGKLECVYFSAGAG
jgi:hypothetical protein